MDLFQTTSIGFWDFALVAGVSLQATGLAYLRAPIAKAILLTIPIPFTLATLAVGAPMTAHHFVGLALLLLYTHLVRVFYERLRIPIVFAIVAAVAVYITAAAFVNRLPLNGEKMFWAGAAVMFVLAWLIYAKSAHRNEPAHRTPLPLYCKLPMIVAIVVGLVALKGLLTAFIATFPMVGVLAAYEARQSLRTICRQIPVVLLTMVPMICVIHLVETNANQPLGIAAGWVVFLLLLIPIAIRQWREAETQLHRDPHSVVGA